MGALHDFVYTAVCEVCRDKEYVYASFLRAFEALARGIYGAGALAPEGWVEAKGVKGECDAVFGWALRRRVSYAGQNEVEVRCRFVSKATGKTLAQRTATFDVSTGEEV